MSTASLARPDHWLARRGGRRRSALPIAGTLWCVLLIATGFVSLLGSGPATALDSTAIVQRPVVAALLPQGWGYFTRDPRGRQTIGYVRTSDHWERLKVNSELTLGTGFGLNRSNRAHDRELSVLLSTARRGWWIDCPRDDVESCVSAAERQPRRISNGWVNPTLCGDVLAITGEPRPWSWPDESDLGYIHLRALVLESKC